MPLRPAQPLSFLQRLLALLLLAGLSACASLPPPPSSAAGRVPQGARVGLLVVGLDASAVHEHVGTTVFNNFTAPRSLPWHLGDRVKGALGGSLSAAGYTVVDLNPADVPPSAASELLVADASSWKPKPTHAALFARLKRDMNLAAVIVVTGQPTLASRECLGGGCSDRIAPKSGLFTRGMFGLDTYFAVAAFDVAVVQTDPPVKLSAYEPLRSAQAAKVQRLPNFAEPKVFQRLSEQEFAPVVRAIDAHVQRVAAATAQALSQGAR